MPGGEKSPGRGKTFERYAPTGTQSWLGSKAGNADALLIGLYGLAGGAR